jgi:hypothetical protein
MGESLRESEGILFVATARLELSIDRRSCMP